MFDNKMILVIGGIGLFGNKFVCMMFEKYNFKKIIIYLCDEMKQWEMVKYFKDESCICFFIGDVCDKDCLYCVLDGVDFVVYVVVIKIVFIVEYNLFECVKININGVMNVIDVCIDKGIECVVVLFIDKVSSLVNLYGVIKLVFDKLFVVGNFYFGVIKICFVVVCYGNVMGFCGFVILFFLFIKDKGELLIIDDCMICFMIILEQGVELVWYVFNDMEGGEIYVKKILLMKVIDVVMVVVFDVIQKVIGICLGEKLYE